MFKIFKKKKMIGKLTVEQYERKRDEHNYLAKNLVYPQETKDYHLKFLYESYILFCKHLLSFDANFHLILEDEAILDRDIAKNASASDLRLSAGVLHYALRLFEMDRALLDQQIHDALCHYRFSDDPDERERNDITYLFTVEDLKKWDQELAKTPEGSYFSKVFDVETSSCPLEVGYDFVFSEDMVQLFKGVLDKICEHYYDNVVSTLDTGLYYDYTPYFLGGETYADLLAPFYEKANKYRKKK